MCVQNNLTPFDSTIQLFGTLGCHLCDIVQQYCEWLADSKTITWQYVDIIDLPLDEMERLSLQIPVVSYKQKQLLYPFSIQDLCCFIDNMDHN